jgi:hypothetical protein
MLLRASSCARDRAEAFGAEPTYPQAVPSGDRAAEATGYPWPGVGAHRFSITPRGWETAPDCFVQSDAGAVMCHALLVVLALSGCTLPAVLTQEELAERWADRCAAWGIGATSPDFEQCLINQEMLDELIRQRRLEGPD